MYYVRTNIVVCIITRQTHVLMKQVENSNMAAVVESQTSSEAFGHCQ